MASAELIRSKYNSFRRQNISIEGSIAMTAKAVRMKQAEICKSLHIPVEYLVLMKKEKAK